MSSSRLRFFGIFASIIILIGVAIIVFNPSLLGFLSPQPRPGSCLILEEKYCKTVTFIPNNIYIPNYKGGKLAAYKLPVGAVIFSPSLGDLSPVTVSLRHSPSDIFINQGGYILSESTSQHSQETSNIFTILFNKAPYLSLQIKKGTPIGKITSTSPISFFGDYNLVIALSKQTAYLVYGQNGNHNTPTKAIIIDDTKELKKLLQPPTQ